MLPEAKIKTPQDLIEAYPEDYQEFLNKMYLRWITAMATDKGDEAFAARSFVQNFVQAIPNVADVAHLITYVETNSNEVNPHALACWLIIVANDPEIQAGGSPKADVDFFNGWRESKPV